MSKQKHAYRDEAWRARLAQFTVERAGAAILWMNIKGEVAHANQEACRRLEYTYEEITQLVLHDINPDFDASTLVNFFSRLRVEGQIQFESHHHTKSGHPIPVEISSNYISFEGVEYTCSIIRNITKRRQREAELNKAFQEIKLLKERLEAENSYLQEEIITAHNLGEIVSQSDAFARVLNQVQQVAPTGSTVLIQGESGTGKELIARALHQLSPRADRPMIKVNCAALPASLIESELFGHEKGAFTGALSKKLGRFEVADRGTIFLDEIGEMPMELQSKLLRALQEGEFERVGSAATTKVDVRVIAATNRNLEAEIDAGNFREDLFYRLNVFPINCIPLRERKEDIPLLVEHFCKKLEPKIGKRISRIPKKVIQQLMRYDFPGNIRELENMIERAIILSKNEKLDLSGWLPRKEKKAGQQDLKTLDQVQREHIVETLKYTNWRVSGAAGAAKILGLAPTTLESRMKKLNIRRSMEVG